MIYASEFADIAAAVSYMNTNGGILIISDVRNFSQPINIGMNWSILCEDGGVLQWSGSVEGSLIETPVTNVYRGRRNRIRIDSGTHSGDIIRVHSAFNCDFDIHHTGFSITNTLLRLTADSVAGGDGYSQRNVAACKFKIRSEGTVGTVVKISGLSPNVSNFQESAQVVTLCNFEDIFSHNAYVKGIDIQNWSDNNIFSGFTRLGGSSSDYFVGVDFGSIDGGGVYSNVFEALAVDTFGAHVGRIGVRFRANTKANEVRMMHQDPEAEGGPVVADAACLSYIVNRMKASTGVVVREARGVQTSGWIKLSDDSATSIALGGGAAAERIAHLRVVGDDLNANGLFHVSVGTSVACNPIWRGSNIYTDYGVGAPLTGIVGNDHRFTVRACSDGKVYVENRLGYPVRISLFAEEVIGA